MENTINEHSPFIYLFIILKNLVYPAIIFLFNPLYIYLVEVLPFWKEILMDFKEIANAIVIVLVIIKLCYEILKLRKK